MRAVTRVLVVTAVAAERDAVVRGLVGARPPEATSTGGVPLPGYGPDGLVRVAFTSATSRAAAPAPTDPAAAPAPAAPVPAAPAPALLAPAPAAPATDLLAPAPPAPAAPVAGLLAPADPAAAPAPADPAAAPAPADPAAARFRGVRVDVLVAGVGPAAAGAAAGAALAVAAVREEPYDVVVSAGIGGGFRPEGDGTGARVGGLVVADAIVAADLGAETPDGFAPVTELGFGTVAHQPPAALVRAVARTTGAVRGAVLTVSTVTGSAARAAALRDRHPGAAAEAMEGFGVAEAAAAHGVPVLEIRAVSNPVGPRDRAAWRIGEALDALRLAFERLASLPPASTLESALEDEASPRTGPQPPPRTAPEDGAAPPGTAPQPPPRPAPEDGTPPQPATSPAQTQEAGSHG
ncbi:futalosine hydrolase [Streptomyces sp. XD-27]|uniref:futalosine hydrolase n=1 Tax=Streptomyces sp. XD-27 TaxID=3062779 RepID=UPI0026F47DDD|nr:futalosine hydrolase [Streptomyces sp. XD-27]WKX74283.1 futalosine hydrolase [Streptomyces sp. XD-27]